MDLVEAAKHLTGVNWNLRAGVLEQAEDGTLRQSPPSLKELQEYLANGPLAYIDKRVAEYPSLTDQLDALWKGEPYTSQMKQQILDIKQKYPK